MASADIPRARAWLRVMTPRWDSTISRQDSGRFFDMGLASPRPLQHATYGRFPVDNRRPTPTQIIVFIHKLSRAASADRAISYGQHPQMPRSRDVPMIPETLSGWPTRRSSLIKLLFMIREDRTDDHTANSRDLGFSMITAIPGAGRPRLEGDGWGVV